MPNIFHDASSPLDPAEVGSVSGIVLLNVPCAASVFVSAMVRMSGVNAVNALADDLTNSNVLGICVFKTTSTLCNVRVSGLSESIFTGLDITKEYYLSDTTDGEITTVVPTTSGHVVYKLGIPFSATEFVIDKGNRTVKA